MKLSKEQLQLLGEKYRLSPREIQVLELLFEGLPTNRALAEALETTEDAAKAAVRNLYYKTGTRSKHELVLHAICALREHVLDVLHLSQQGFLRGEKNMPRDEESPKKD